MVYLLNAASSTVTLNSRILPAMVRIIFQHSHTRQSTRHLQRSLRSLQIWSGNCSTPCTFRRFQSVQIWRPSPPRSVTSSTLKKWKIGNRRSPILRSITTCSYKFSIGREIKLTNITTGLTYVRLYV